MIYIHIFEFLHHKLDSNKYTLKKFSILIVIHLIIFDPFIWFKIFNVKLSIYAI